MKIVGIVLALALAIAPGVAAAAFTAGTVVTNYRVSQVTPYVYETTTASVSDTVDLSACGGGVTATFEQSVSDASTDAKVELRACAKSSDTWPDCTLLRVGPADLPDGVAVAIGNYPTAKPYALVRLATAPAGGDTTRVTLACTEETTTEDGGGGSGASTPAGFQPGGLANQACRASDGVCPNPAGAIVIDPWIGGWMLAPGQRHDDDASMWTGTANDVTDFSNYSSVMTITGSGVAQWGTVVQAGGNVADPMFCRGNASPYPIAATDGTCSAGTCTTTLTAAFDPLIFKLGTRYFFSSASSYNGCNSSNNGISTTTRFPVAVATGDSFQSATFDGVHPNTYYYRWLAQQIIEARWEATYWPKVNVLGGDEIKSGVVQNALGQSCTNWTKNAGSAGVINQSSVSTRPAYPTSVNAVRGNACYLSSARAAGDSIRTPSGTVVPGHTYAFHGWVRMNSNLAGDTNTVRVSPFDAGTDTALGATEFKTFFPDGYNDPPRQGTATGDSGHEVCSTWCYVVVLVKPTTATSIYIDIAGMNSTGNLLAEGWVGFPSIYDELSLHYLFPDAGRQSFWIDTDSRGLNTGDNHDRIAAGLDTMKALTRPLFTLLRPFATSVTATAGQSLANELSAGFLPFVSHRPQYGIIHLGVNDAGAYSSANLVSASDLVRQAGVVPVILLEGPYRGDTADTTFCGGVNCTSGIYMAQEYLFLKNGNAN